MTEIMNSHTVTGPFTDEADGARHNAPYVPADISNRPKALRIRAGDLCVELDWSEPTEIRDVQAQVLVPASAPVTVPIPPRAPAPSGIMLPVEPARSEPAEVTSPPRAANVVEYCSPTVGTFYRSSEPGAAPFAQEGDHIRKGQQIGIVEAMKLMIPLEAEFDGQLSQVLVEDNTPVEFGVPLFAFVPSSAA